METLWPYTALHEYPLEVYAGAYANYEAIPRDKFDILSCGEHVLIKEKDHVYHLFTPEDLRALYRSYLISSDPRPLQTLPAAFWESQLRQSAIEPADLVLELRPLVCAAWESAHDDLSDLLPLYLFDQVASQFLEVSDPKFHELIDEKALLPHVIRFIRGLYPDFRVLAAACADYWIRQCRDEDDVNETLMYEPQHHPAHFYRFRASSYYWDEQQFRAELVHTVTKNDRDK